MPYPFVCHNINFKIVISGATILRVALLNASIYESTICEMHTIPPHGYFKKKKNGHVHIRGEQVLVKITKKNVSQY